MSDRDEFEKRFPKPDCVAWEESRNCYRTMRSGLQSITGRYNESWEVWQAARAQGGEWVRCSERLPTEADDDYQGCVWALFEDGDIELMEAEEVEQTWDDDISITHWMATGLKRPAPPTEREDGHEH